VRYPYERFLRFLVSRKVPVDRTVGRYGLPLVGGLWEAECRTDIRKTAPYSVTQYIDADDDQEMVVTAGFLEWAEKEGIRPLWEIQKEFGGRPPSPELDTAFQIFVNPFSRAVVGMMLLSQATTEEVVELVTGRFDLGVDLDVIGAYTKIFWDTKLLGRTGWRSFIEELKTKEEKHFISLGLQSPTVEEVRQYLGMNTCFTPEDIATRIMSRSFAQYESAMDQPDPESANAVMWADLALRAMKELRETKRVASKEDDGLPSGDFNGMFSVQVEKIEHISLAELQGQVSPRDDAKSSGDE
jgi:hypothetical protein